ncbi:hypothetical protein Tco_0595744 [Tanacetum coccineum]
MEKKSRRETMTFPRLTKVIINHFLSQHKSLSKLKFQHYHRIKDDGIVNRLKFGRIGEDYQEYGLPIPDMMLNNDIKQSYSYQMFLKYSTGLIPPKKSRGKGSQGKKTADVSQQLVDVSDNSEPEPEPTKKKTDIMQALKEIKKTSRRQPYTEESSEGTSRILGVPDESTVVSATSSEGTEYSQLNSDKEDKKDNDGDVDDEDKDNDHISDIQGIDDEDAETESDEDEIYKYKIQVHKDVDVEIVEAETVKRENKEKDENTDAAKAEVEKTTEEKGDAELAGNAMISDYQVKESTDLPLPSASLSVSSGFGTHFLNLSSDVSLTGVLKDSIEAEIISLIDTTTLPPIPEIPTKTPISTALSPPHITPTISIVQQTTTPIPTPPIITEAPTITTVVPKSDALIVTMNENKSFNRNPTNHALYHALMKALIEDENAMDKGVADMVKNHKRQHDDDKDNNEEPSARPN